MPIHFEDLDVASQVEESSSALIVPCNLCPGVTVAVREGKPFMQLFRSLFRSAPFEHYIEALRSRLEQTGVSTTVFRSSLYHHWFVCMWTAGRRKKLRKRAAQHDTLIVLGCDSATETVRKAVESMDCKVVEGMQVTGIMNAQLRFHWPCDICFEDCSTVPISGRKEEGGTPSLAETPGDRGKGHRAEVFSGAAST
jgi:hypothetical protein